MHFHLPDKLHRICTLLHKPQKEAPNTVKRIRGFLCIFDVLIFRGVRDYALPDGKRKRGHLSVHGHLDGAYALAIL